VLTPGRKICGYSVGARRSDFSAPSETFCEYFAVQTTLTSQRTLYTYEYLTIGSEPIGRALSTTVAGNLCASVWSPASALGVACPETVAGCTGLTSITPEASLLLSTSTCRLKIGGTSSTLSSTPDPNLGTHVIRSQADQGNLGRFTNFRAGVDQPYTIVDENHRACGAVVPPVDPDSYKDELAAPRGFCAAIGTGVGDGGVDAGALGGPSADAGSAGDAGQLAGTEADAGQSLDAGTVTDAGNELDSGRQTEADAGTSTVAGVHAVGCGCSESPGALGFALFLLISSRTAAPRARRR